MLRRVEALRPLGLFTELPRGVVFSETQLTFEGGRAEKQEIKRAIEQVGYKVSRLSVRSEFPGGTY